MIYLVLLVIRVVMVGDESALSLFVCLFVCIVVMIGESW